MEQERYEEVQRFKKMLAQYMRDNNLTGSKMSAILMGYLQSEGYRMHVYLYGDWWKMNDPDSDMYEYQ